MNGSPLHYLETTSSKPASLGTPYRQEQSGRSWRLSENGGTQADPGKLMVQAAHSTDFADLAPTAAVTAGSREITLTLGSTGLTAGDFEDGFAVVQDGAGEGIAYQIEGHGTYDAAATDAEIVLKEEVQVALATTSDVDLVKNLYKDVVISSTDQADKPAGVFNVQIAADAFGMIQTWGPAAVWQDTTNGVGDFLVTGSGVAGQVEVMDADGEPFIGHQGPFAGAATDYQLVYLRLER